MEEGIDPDRGACLRDFRLFETRSNFYMVGHDESRTFWRILKIGRLEPGELNVSEDATMYSETECHDILKRIDEGNKRTGGLKFVTNCYGIVGFVKFLGPYYMLIITRRRQIGTICGHAIYAINKSKMIALQNSTMLSNITKSKHENRYKKLLCTLDLTRDFYFSYSYRIMHSLQKNLYDGQARQVYETMFVWNDFLTRGIRNHLKSTLWTVPLVYGFFKQAKLAISGKEFKLTLIARRSRYYAGTRYLRRGVNEKGSVANDVETEQIVFEDVPGGWPTQVTSVVQNRGSIPLYWSQETSRLNLQPDIILQKKDQNYEATRLHFENLVDRYGNPIIILNLIKTQERKPRESKLRDEFINAIHFINRDAAHETRLKFLHWDVNRRPRRKATDVLELLGQVAANTLALTGFFYTEMTPGIGDDDSLGRPTLGYSEVNNLDKVPISTGALPENNNVHATQSSAKDPTLQNGVLRTNCIDCLDRTNVAQYAYGLAALGHQLFTLGLIDTPRIELDSELADNLMSFYETMGDTLAVQYTGSAAHNKIFSERRGHWKAAIQSQEFLRTLQRYYSNAYTDAEKQDAINIFLGYFQPREGEPALWELDSHRYYDARGQTFSFMGVNSRSFFRRSLSDGSILQESGTPESSQDCKRKLLNSVLPDEEAKSKVLSESSPEISTCDSDISYSRCTPTGVASHFFTEKDHTYNCEHMSNLPDFSNFLDIGWFSLPGNSRDEQLSEGSPSVSSSLAVLTNEKLVNGETGPFAPSTNLKESDVKGTNISETEWPDNNLEFSKNFFNWVVHGETLCHGLQDLQGDSTCPPSILLV